MRNVCIRLVSVGAVVGCLALALAFRLPRLGERPMHGDEANQAVRAGELMDDGVYHYDPSDHHGPVLYYAALPFCRASAKTFAETTEKNFRLVPVVFGLLTMLLMAALFSQMASMHVFRMSQKAESREGVVAIPCGGSKGQIAALLLFAVSPAFCYYNRFFIQESLLVCFLTGMLLSAVCWVQAAERGSRAMRCATAAFFGMFAGFAVATKETFILSFAAAGIALVCCLLPKSGRPSSSVMHRALPSLGIAVLAAAFISVLFYSSFFTYWHGVYDALFSTVAAYAHRAVGVPEHQHPWWFYFQTVFGFQYGRGPLFSEALLLPFALVALVRAFRVKEGTFFARFLVVYTLVLTALYSAIPYKTPWCCLSFLQGWILLAALGFGELLALLSGFARQVPRACLFAALLGLVGWHGVQAWRACYKYPADPRNPYVYAHTGSDCLNLVAKIHAAAQKASGWDTVIAFAVPTPDTWPLPWYLRKYRNVGYWTCVADIPAALRPAIVVAAANQGDAAEERFGKDMGASFYGVRPGTLVNLFTLKEKK